MSVSLISIAVTLCVIGIVLWLISAFITQSFWFYKTEPVRELGDLIGSMFLGIAEIPRMLAVIMFGIAAILFAVNYFA